MGITPNAQFYPIPWPYVIVFLRKTVFYLTNNAKLLRAEFWSLPLKKQGVHVHSCNWIIMNICGGFLKASQPKNCSLRNLEIWGFRNCSQHPVINFQSGNAISDKSISM